MWTDHKTQWTWQEILMSPKIEPAPFVCNTVYVCVWRRCIMVLQIILYFLISSNTVGGGWDGSNCKGKMNAGEWINGGKALFNHCSADGTFIFSSMTHTQHINNNKTSVSFRWILTLLLDIHLLRKNSFPILGSKPLPLSFPQYLKNFWWCVSEMLSESMDLQLPIFSQRHE